MSLAPQILSVAPDSQQLALQLSIGTGGQRVDTVTRPCAVNPKGQELMPGPPDPQAEGRQITPSLLAPRRLFEYLLVEGGGTRGQVEGGSWAWGWGVRGRGDVARDLPWGGRGPTLTSDALTDTWTRAPQLLQSHRPPQGALTQPHQLLHGFSDEGTDGRPW
jgi:hypothetical protein